MEPKRQWRNDLQSIWGLRNYFLPGTGVLFQKHLISAPPLGHKNSALAWQNTWVPALPPATCAGCGHPPQHRPWDTQDMWLILPSARVVVGDINPSVAFNRYSAVQNLQAGGNTSRSFYQWLDIYLMDTLYSVCNSACTLISLKWPQVMSCFAKPLD